MTTNKRNSTVQRGTSFEAQHATVKELWSYNSNEMAKQRDKR